MATEDEMVGWHHQLNGHEFEQTLGDGEGQGSLACCSPWGHKQLDMTKQLYKNRAESRECSLILIRLYNLQPFGLQGEARSVFIGHGRNLAGFLHGKWNPCRILAFAQH